MVGNTYLLGKREGVAPPEKMVEKNDGKDGRTIRIY